MGLMSDREKIGNPGLALTFIFTMLAMLTWADYMGFFTGPVYLVKGLVELACYIPYLIGAVLFFLKGDTVNGTIYLIFATLFGGVGGFLDLAYAASELLEFEVCRQMAAIPYFWGALSMVPMIISVRKTASPVSILCYVCADSFLTLMLPAAFGIFSEPLNAVVAWLNLAVGITGMYTLISGLLAAGGCRPLPEGKPAAKTDSVLGKGEENYETGCGRQH